MAFLARLSNQERRALYIAIGLVTLALLNHFVFNPTLAKLKSIRTATKQKREELEVDLVYTKQKENIQKEYQEIEKYLQKPSHEPQTELLERLKNLGTHLRRCDTTRPDTKPGNPEKGIPTKHLITVELEGTGENVARFIYNVTSDPFLLRIERMELTPKKVITLAQAKNLTTEEEDQYSILKGLVQISWTVMP